MEAAETQSLLIITGSMGSGKTAVLGEATDILTLRGIPHAAIDLDMLGMAHLPGPAENDAVMYRNLNVVWQNYVALGVDRLLLARAIENHTDLKRCVAVVGEKKRGGCVPTCGVD